MSEDIIKEALEALPSELTVLISAVGFSKVAAAMTGVDFNSERAAYEHIGTQFFARRKEAALIARGVRALELIGER